MFHSVVRSSFFQPFLSVFVRFAVLRTVASLILAFATCSVFGQSLQTEVEILQDELGLEKKVAVANFMQLDDDAAVFWEIYDDYEAERKELAKERIKVVLEYAASFSTITDEEILAFYKRRKAYSKSYDKLQQKYFKRMQKEVGVSQAAQFWQLEMYINSIVQANIYAQIPFIGDKL